MKHRNFKICRQAKEDRHSCLFACRDRAGMPDLLTVAALEFCKIHYEKE